MIIDNICGKVFAATLIGRAANPFQLYPCCKRLFSTNKERNWGRFLPHNGI